MLIEMARKLNEIQKTGKHTKGMQPSTTFVFEVETDGIRQDMKIGGVLLVSLDIHCYKPTIQLKRLEILEEMDIEFSESIAGLKDAHLAVKYLLKKERKAK